MREDVKMRFSIIIPAHNAEHHIRKCLDSIKQQTFTDYELIVICDSCTDHTEEIAREYGAIIDRVCFGRDGLTRNRGLEKAKGEWVLFLDDDDWWLHEYVLSQINQKLIENPDIDVLAFSFILLMKSVSSETFLVFSVILILRSMGSSSTISISINSLF